MSRADILGIFFLVAALSVVSVRGQLVSCRASPNCDGGTGDNLGLAASGERCCLDNPDAMGYNPVGTEDCFPCIVFGFLNASFSGVEQGPGHSLPVGYLKGRLQGPSRNIPFDVTNTPGTARASDYTVNTARTAALVSGRIMNVVLTLRVDTIAQEPNETFTLTLVPSIDLAAVGLQGEGIFFRNTIEVTIIDNDDVNFEFTEDDYRANEPDPANPNPSLPVVVFKSARIASRVELVVVPLTVQEARATSLPEPPNVPDDDMNSPPYANLADFDNTNITLIFEPDEDVDQPINEKSARISVTDDAINEAMEQVFIAELMLVSSFDSSSIQITRPSTLCRIIDNDPIRIGFELPGYNYTEPQFDEFIDAMYMSVTGRPENGPIFLVKEDNVTSEQTFLVSLQVTESAPPGTQTAALGQDYRFGSQPGQTSATEFFLPFQQRIAFQFELLADTLPEGNEAFQASVSPEDSLDVGGGVMVQFPTSRNPLTLRSEIFITILDDDFIVIGFTNTSYTVDEGIGTLQVEVEVTNPPENQPLPAMVDIYIESVSGSAIGGSDYRNIIAEFFDVILTFSDTNRREPFSVVIIDDPLFEFDVENFTLELRFDPFAPEPSNVILSPNVSTIEILDDDVVVIGFLNTSYTVGESDGVANIQIGVLSEGSLERPVVVRFSTTAISASDGSDYNGIASLDFTFDSVTRTVDASVPLVGDSIFELTELFGANLSFPGAPPPRVTLAPDSATVTILDDDVLTFGFEPVVYSVSESVGSVDLGVFFLSGNAGEFVPHVNASTNDGTATGSASGGEADYTSIVDQTISFTTANRMQDLTVQILADDFTEFDETFTAVLSSVFLARTAGGAAIELTDQERGRLIISPDTATVNITDDDVAVIGFVNTALSITEDGGDLEFEIAVRRGTLRFDVLVDFATANGAALAGEDYEATSRSLTFNGQSRQSIFVPIINDTRFEDDENFFGRLSAPDVLPPNVRLDPIEANATIIDDEGIIIGFDPVAYDVNEPDGSVSLMVRLIEGTISEGRNILVRISTADDSAQAPSDYGAISQVLTFSSSMTVQPVNVNIVNDDLLEIDEVFSASLTLVNPVIDARVQLLPDSAGVTILDDDEAIIGFVPEAYLVTEGTNLSVNLNVELISGQLGREVIVNFDTFDGSAVAGFDYGGIAGRQLIFGPAVSSLQVQVSIQDDNLLEISPEYFTANLTSAVPRLTLLPDEATVDILDDDDVTFGFDATQYNVIENAGFVNVTIRQTSGGPLNRDVHITLQTGDGTAISSGERDFEAHSMDLTFGPGVTEQVVMIRIIDDSRLEEDEQFNSFVSLTVSDPAISLSPDRASITIIDNDRVVIGFDQPIYDVNEDAGQAVVIVELRNGILRRPVTVNIDTADDTALDGSDYSAIVPRALVFDRNTPNFSIAIDIIDDQVHELIEEFLSRLSTDDGDVTLDPQQARVRIADDDVVTFRFRQPMYMFMENVGTGTVCVDKIGETDQTITVTVRGATQNGPFTAMLTFDPNVNSSCIDFDVLNDDIALEDPEEFVWILDPPPSVPRVDISGNTTRVVIIDDDILTLNLEKAQNIPEAIGAAQACVTFSNPFARAFEISPNVGRPPNSSAPAIATPGEDYGDVIAAIMANPGDSQACFNITINNDLLVEESEECLMASFTAEPLMNLEIGTSSSICCIVDDDTVTIGFDPDQYSVNEDDGSVSLTVRVLAGELARAVSVNFFTVDGSATSTPPADFVSIAEASPIILQFSPGDLQGEATVTIIDDTITEDPEQFIGLLSSTDPAVILAPMNASVEILDNDPVTIGFDPDEYTVNEPDGSVTLMVRLISGVLEREVVVDFETSPGSATSAAPSDYERTVTQLTFSPTVDVNPVPVNIVNDNIHEDSETFFGNLAADADQPVILNPERAVVTIIDDNDPITIGFERTEYNVTEGGQTEVCALLMEGTLEKEVPVSVSSSDGTANVGADYIAVAETLVFDADTNRVCFFTTAVDDILFEDEEVYRLTLTSDEPGLTLDPDEATVTIPNEDPITIGLTNTTFVVTEGDGAFVEVCARVFEGILERNAVVTLQTMDGTALSQGAEPDYAPLTVQLTFTPSMTEICRNVVIVNDVYYEDPEDLTVGLTTDEPNVVLMPDTGTITIVDDEQIIIGFVEPSYVVLEGAGQVEVCAEIIDGNLRTTVAVEFSTADGDATAPGDYTATTATFTFSQTQNQDCVNVPIISDGIAEGSESFTGNLDTTAPRVTLDPDVTEVTISDIDLLPIGFIDPPYTTQEASGFVTVSVGVLDNGTLEDDFIVTLETNDIVAMNAAQAGVDYQPLTRNLTFSPTVKRIDLNVTIVDDNIVELTETFEGQLTAVTVGPNVRLDPRRAQINILDDPEDRVTIGVTETLIPVSEDIGVREVCAVVFAGDLERNVEVILSLNPLTATAGSDFVMESFTLVFGENVRGPICNNVTIINDDIYEFEEELSFNLSTTDSSVDLDPASGIMIISDEDNVVIGWVAESYQFSENAMQARICAAVRDGSLAVTLPALGIDLRDGTASRGTPTITQDYIPTPTPDNFVFTSTNMGPLCTTIPIVSDNLLEETIEDFFADLAFAAGNIPDRVRISPAVTRVDIIDDDRITIGFLETRYTVSEGFGNAALMVGVISGDLETNIVVNISTADDTAISTDPADYTSVLDQSLTFSTQLPPMTVLVPIIDDDLDEEDLERFTASLVLVTNNPRVQIAPPLAEVIIEDNDVVTIGFERTMYNTPENNTISVMVCASVRPPPSLAKTVEVNLASMDGTAIAPGDYNAIATTLTFSPGMTRQCVEFTGIEDGIVEPNENFTVTLTSNDDVNLNPDVAVVTIVEGIVITVGFVEQMYTFVENQGRVRIQVRKDFPSDEPFMVRVRGGPSTSSPIEQSAAAIDEIITFEAGPAAPDVIDIFIDLTDDLVALEATESYIATLEVLGTPSSRIVIGEFPMTNISVLDDDRVTVGFGSAGVSVQESSGQFMMCVVRDREALQDITVTISSEDGSAISDVDYTPSGIQTTVTISASDPDRRECFTGPIIDDLIALEPDETFTLRIDSISPDSSRIDTGIDTTVVTIIDDDVVRVRFAQPDYIFREESGLATVCLVKDLETAVSFEVNSTTVQNSAFDPLDYMGGTFDVTFGAAAGDTQCINIILVSDSERESLEDFFVDVDLNDMGPVRAGNPSRTIVGIEDTGIPANDTVIGDPLMTVPILVQDSVLQMLNATRLSLCYEIHGEADQFFNLVTDDCTTVNAHYHDLTSYLNVIDQIGVRAVDDNRMCRNIQVDVNGCVASIDGRALAAGDRYSSGGISVRSYSNRVRISVPNCADVTLVMWVICETRTLEDPFGNGQVTGDMIKFVVMRGLNFGHRMAHGLLGQFWNIPVSVEPFKGLDRNGNPVPQRYVVNITSSFSNEARSYTGWLYDLTWSFEEGPCLYVGNRQAGPIYEVKDPNDPIIEGRYSDYLVQDLFSEEEFKYTLFKEDNCIGSTPGPEIPPPVIN